MIDLEAELLLNERSTMDFVLNLRKRWSNTLYPTLVHQYKRQVGTDALSTEAVQQRLREMPIYPWFSHIERTQQKMMWRIAGDVVLDRRKRLVPQLDDVSKSVNGSLRLEPEMELPEWYTKFDIHIQPGSFYSDDLSAFVYELGARIVMLRDNDGYKFHKLFVESALPDISQATSVLDMGCGFGKSTVPLVDKYPNARVVGCDLAAPGLRLAHANAAEADLPIDYVQADARFTGLDDGSCDVVTGTMLLHEMPGHAIKDTIKEAARLLKPGGSLRFLEFKLTGDPVRDATVYEHAERNNEPYFRDLFATDLVAVCEQEGLTGAAWTPFDERSDGLSADGWGARSEWHFPWAVLSATKSEDM